VGQGFLITGLSLLFAWRGLGLLGQFLALILGALAYHAALLVVACRRFGGGMLRLLLPARVDPQAAADLRHLSWPNFTLVASNRVSLLTDTILIARLLGPVQVVPFYFTRRLAQLVIGQINAVGGATWASLAELHALGHRDVFNRRLLELSNVLMVLGLAAAIPIVCYNDRFVAWWVRGEAGQNAYAGLMLTGLACAVGIVSSLVSFWDAALAGTGHVRERVPVALVATAINLAASVLCTVKLGLIGPLIGSLVAYFGCILWWYPGIIRSAYGISALALYAPVIGPVVLAAAVGVPAWWITRGTQDLAWYDLGARMAGLGVAYLLLAWPLVLNGHVRSLLVQRLINPPRPPVAVQEAQP
jgi:O-antigen/teichoic acid export membrane protein